MPVRLAVKPRRQPVRIVILKSKETTKIMQGMPGANIGTVRKSPRHSPGAARPKTLAEPIESEKLRSKPWLRLSSNLATRVPSTCSR